MSMCAFRNPIWVLDLFRYVKPYKKHSTGPDSRILKGFSLYTFIRWGIFIFKEVLLHFQDIYCSFQFSGNNSSFQVTFNIHLFGISCCLVNSWSVIISGYTPFRQIIVSLCILHRQITLIIFFECSSMPRGISLHMPNMPFIPCSRLFGQYCQYTQYLCQKCRNMWLQNLPEQNCASNEHENIHIHPF